MDEVKEIISMNGIKGKSFYIEKNEKLGFKSPYIIFVPEEVLNNILVVNPVNTGCLPVTLNEAREDALIQANKKNWSLEIAFDLGMPLLVPLFPNIRGLYVHQITSSVYNNDLSLLEQINSKRDKEEKLSEEEILEIKDVTFDIPKQLVNMIENSKKLLESFGITLSDKVIMEGYSASGQFSNLFTALYPEKVLTCICGGNQQIVPMNKLCNKILNFPLGTADIKNFNLKAFLNIPQLYYIGDNDYNDPALVKCKFVTDSLGERLKDEEGYFIPIKDENGQVIPVLDKSGNLQAHYPDCYTNEEVRLIQSLLGKNPLQRFENLTKIYHDLGVNAIFKKIPGGHKSIMQNKTEDNKVFVAEMIKDFINDILNNYGIIYTSESKDTIVR